MCECVCVILMTKHWGFVVGGGGILLSLNFHFSNFVRILVCDDTSKL